MSSPRPPAPQHHISWQSSSLGWCSPEPGARSTEVRSNKSFTPPSRCARKDWGCPPCALAECPIPLHTTGAPCATTARPSITAPLREIRAPSSPTSNHMNASDTVPLCHCHHTQGGCVCTSALSRHPLEHGNVYCRVNPT